MVTEKQEVFDEAKGLGIVEGDYKGADYKNTTTAQMKKMIVDLKAEAKDSTTNAPDIEEADIEAEVVEEPEDEEKPATVAVKKNGKLWICKTCGAKIDGTDLAEHAKTHKGEKKPVRAVVFEFRSKGFLVSKKTL